MNGKANRKIILKDSTLREGLDTPNVDFKAGQKIKIISLLEKAHVPEVEIVAPAKVFKDLEFVKGLEKEKLKIKTSGLVYAYSLDLKREIEGMGKYLDRFDILMPVSIKRKPKNRRDKIRGLLDALSLALDAHSDVGVGFPHSTQEDVGFLIEIGEKSVRAGAKRVTLYDTNGSQDPFEVYDLVSQLKERLNAVLFFHAHNDLGLASSNALSAVYGGADGLDTTINGLGDRAGNASFEQVVLALHLKGFTADVVLEDLISLSRALEEASGVPLSKLAPVVGEYVFSHKSPSHLETPGLFEAFGRELIGRQRKQSRS